MEIKNKIFELNERCQNCEGWRNHCVDCKYDDLVSEVVDAVEAIPNFCANCDINECDACGATAYSPCPIGYAIDRCFLLPDDFRICYAIGCELFSCPKYRR
ncbi:hypothetical protein DRP07_02230 [Archaeoglobales archaeon]|nr:MAG: hypothetical protein DRP07_02230 [Archaeoglobales archaeon]